MLTKDDITLVHRAMEDASEDILQRYGVKQEELYGRIEKDLKEIQQAICLVRAVPTVPSSPQITELGYELAQLRRLAYETQAWLKKIQEEKEKATEALKQEKDEALEQLQVVWYSVATYESEREEFQAMLQEEKSQLQREKEQLLAERDTVKEIVTKACHYVQGLA